MSKIKKIRHCSRCKCPGHYSNHCPVFIPIIDDEDSYIEEIQRIKRMKLSPISNTNYMKKWCTENGGGRICTPQILYFIQNAEICEEDDSIIERISNYV